MESKKIESIKHNILRLFDDVMTMEGQYSMPYSTADDDYADWSVIYKIDKVSIWETAIAHWIRLCLDPQSML